MKRKKYLKIHGNKKVILSVSIRNLIIFAMQKSNFNNLSLIKL